MNIASVIALRDNLLTQAGRAGLNIKYPKEFELYIIGLELVDENFNTLKYFTFPVNPSSIEESKPNISNVKKTLAGVTVLRTPTFVPTDITISGTFGRNFKILLGGNYEDFIHSFTSTSQNESQFPTTSVTKSSISAGLTQIFDERIKTGYGCLKVLEEIIDASSGIGVNGGTRRLIFHNPALGNSYLVNAGTLRMFQSESSNMIWNYSLSLKSIAPLYSIFTNKQLQDAAKELAIGGFIQRGVNGILNATTKILGL